jgi:hypothetical protein
VRGENPVAFVSSGRLVVIAVSFLFFVLLWRDASHDFTSVADWVFYLFYSGVVLAIVGTLSLLLSCLNFFPLVQVVTSSLSF